MCRTCRQEFGLSRSSFRIGLAGSLKSKSQGLRKIGGILKTSQFKTFLFALILGWTFSVHADTFIYPGAGSTSPSTVVGCGYGVNACNTTYIAPPPIVQMPGTSTFQQYLPMLSALAGPAMKLFGKDKGKDKKNISRDDDSGDAPESFSDSKSGGGGFGFNYKDRVDGKMEDCGSLPGSVKDALQEALDYRNGACKGLFERLGSDKKIAINDYSKSGTPYMYIFTSEGKCLKKTAVTYGNGQVSSRPVPCSDGNKKHMTPPGFHLTEPHIGQSDYNCSNSLGLTSLEGQGSTERGVLIHEAANPGTASSWGCSGVGEDVFKSVQKELGYGSLVFNYFGDTPKGNNCVSNAGMGHVHMKCQVETGTKLTSNMCSSTGLERAPASALSFKPTFGTK